MPLSDKARIAAEQGSPRIVRLWNALTALRSVVSFMNTGAHPDDETSAMLATLRFRDGIDISYACSTRGEGGQNDIGTEATEALGVLRTAEMEAACDVLDLRMYWLSESPDDTIFDFGFSKSGTETLEKWGRAHTIARFVDIVRRERPDIICPTFLDIPGQHGHHRAMTEAAHLVMDLAADPGFDGSDLPAWTVSKLYLPAWSGAGQAYDDDLPPPPATLTIRGNDKDPVTGWSFARIGQQSRALHATQAMGRWVRHGDETDFPLHLARSRVDGPDTELTSGLPVRLSDLPAPEAREHLETAQESIDAALAAFPATADILRHASNAVSAIRRAMGAFSPESSNAFGHKLARKEAQLAHVIRVAAEGDVRAHLARDVLRPGDRVGITYEIDDGAADLDVKADLPTGWLDNGDTIGVGKAAATSDPYPPTYLPGSPQAPCLSVDLTAHGVTTRTVLALETTPVVVPARSATLSPEGDVINAAAANRLVTVQVDDVGPEGADLALRVPEGWRVTGGGAKFTVEAPADVTPRLYRLTLQIDGEDAQSVRHIQRPHIAPRALVRPAEIRVRVVDAVLPEVRVGYIGGGNDRVAHWLGRMGVDVTDLSEADLSDPVLADFDTLVVGIFAMKFRAGLSEAMPRIHEWTRNGGTLLTLYHRPWDNWDADKSAPYRLEIGQPSLRWRVTDENADVDLLEPGHPLLHTPNQIGPEDWADWHKERGLYFAKDWDAAYKPLISMHDPDEQPLRGAWLAADVGAGRHIHTSLILHHQMEKLTPGAFRIMANLVARRT
jgi:LmbE family N-acetylglucosaminyl deacetylase